MLALLHEVGVTVEQLKAIAGVEEWSLEFERREADYYAKLHKVDQERRSAWIVIAEDVTDIVLFAKALLHELIELSSFETWILFHEALSLIPCPKERELLEKKIRNARDEKIERRINLLPFWEDSC